MAVEVKEKTGVSVSFINLSGGVGVNYRPEQKANDIAVIGEGVHRVFDEFWYQLVLVMLKSLPNLVVYVGSAWPSCDKVRHRKKLIALILE